MLKLHAPPKSASEIPAEDTSLGWGGAPIAKNLPIIARKVIIDHHLVL